MLNFLLLKIGKLIYKNPSIHTKSPKMIVVNFDNAKNKKPLFLNLEKALYLELDIEMDKKESTADEFNLIANINEHNETKKVTLACFESKKEALDALYLLTYKMYSPLRGFYRTVLSVIFIFLLAMIGKDILTIWTKSSDVVGNTAVAVRQNSPTKPVDPLSPLVNSNQATVPTEATGGSVMSQNELNKLMQEVQTMTSPENLITNNSVSTTDDESKLAPPIKSPADTFIDELK
jgi:hypothetical protein